MAKREQGYVVTVKMFVPVNAKDLNDTKAKADAIYQAQQANDLSGLSAAGADVMEVKHRWTSREKAEEAVTHEAAESVEEIAEQAQTGLAGEAETIEQEQVRIRAEHEAREAAAEADEETGEDQVAKTEEAASGGTSGRRRK